MIAFHFSNYRSGKIPRPREMKRIHDLLREIFSREEGGTIRLSRIGFGIAERGEWYE